MSFAARGGTAVARSDGVRRGGLGAAISPRTIDLPSGYDNIAMENHHAINR